MGLKRVFQNKLFEVTHCLKLQNHKKLNSFQYKLEGGLYWGRGVASNRMNFFCLQVDELIAGGLM